MILATEYGVSGMGDTHTAEIHAGDVLQYQSAKASGWADVYAINNMMDAGGAIRAVAASRDSAWDYRIVTACRRFVVLV